MINNYDKPNIKPSIIEQLMPKLFKFSPTTLDFTHDELMGSGDMGEIPSEGIRTAVDREKLTVNVRQFSGMDTDEVYEFLKTSKENHGPFRAAISELLSDKNKISHYLSDWNLHDPEQFAKHDELHALFFGSYVNGRLVAATICAVKCNEGVIEIGGFVAPGLKGNGIGEKTGMMIMSELRKNPYYKGTIKKFIFETQLDNNAAKALASKVGVRQVRQDSNGITFEFDF